MQTIVYNPQEGRLETIDIDFTADNTTWFSQCNMAGDVAMITDFNGDLVISEFGYTYPLRIYDMSRADISYDRRRAMELRRRYE